MKVGILYVLEKYMDYQPVQITDYVPVERSYQEFAEVTHTVDYQPVTKYPLLIPQTAEISGRLHPRGTCGPVR